MFNIHAMRSTTKRDKVAVTIVVMMIEEKQRESNSNSRRGGFNPIMIEYQTWIRKLFQCPNQPLRWARSTITEIHDGPPMLRDKSKM